jgi:hypothetical protein
MASYRKVDVSKELAACVKHIGGQLLDEIATTGQRADYWFPQHNVIGELKCLATNYFDDVSFLDWLRTRYDTWVRDGTAPLVYGRATINLAELPTACSDEVTSYLRNRLDRTIKEANTQIKASSLALKIPNALGLVVLVNDGNSALPPGMIANILRRSIPAKFSAINGVVYFSANLWSDLPGVNKDLLVWCSWGFRSVRPTVPQDLISQLSDTWIAHHSKLLGEKIEIIGAAPEDIYKVKFRGPPPAI